MARLLSGVDHSSSSMLPEKLILYSLGSLTPLFVQFHEHSAQWNH